MAKRLTKPVITQIAHQVVVAAISPPPTSPTHIAINLASAAIGRVTDLKPVPASAKKLRAKKQRPVTAKANQGRRAKKSTKTK